MEIPQLVLKTFEKLKLEYKFYVVLELINKHYYVYRHESIWDKTTKKRKTKSEYLGKITDDGAFIKKSVSKEEKLLEASRAAIEAHGGRVLWPSTPEELQTGIFTNNEVDNELITMLSINARESIIEISKKLGVSESTTSHKIKKVEETFGIKYTIDATLERFHRYQFIATVKFVGERPNPIELKNLLVADPRIRLALSTRGVYDLFLFIFVNDPLEAEEIVYKLRSTPLLAGHKAKWNVTYHSQSHGFIPLRDEFFDLVKERVWKRSRESPRKQPGQFFYREYATLRELSQNSSVPFNYIDEKYGLKHGSAQHTYHKLLEDGTIRSTTITMNKPPVKDTAVIILKQEDIGEFNKYKKEFFKFRLADENVLLNKFIFSGDIGSPYGLLLIAPLYKDGDLEKLEADIMKMAKGAKLQTSVISNILIGNLGFRKIESKHTHLYKRLQEND